MQKFKSFMAAARKPNFIPFGLFPRGSDLSWIAANPMMPNLITPDGTQNGTNDTFTVDAQFTDVWLFKNGQLQTQGTDYTFNGDTGTITWAAASIPGPSDVVKAALFTGTTDETFQGTPSSSAATVEVPAGSIDGTNDTFTLSKTPESLSLYLNGVRLRAGVGYSLAGSSITMAAGYIPQTGDSLVAVFW